MFATAFSNIYATCKNSQVSMSNRAYQVANVVDALAVMALLIVGLLGSQGVLAISPAASWACIGAGMTYFVWFVVGLITKCKC